jgi:CHAT domain-containing protein
MFMSVLLLGGAAYGTAVMLPAFLPWLPGLCIAVLIWRLARDFYLASFDLVVADDSFRLNLPAQAWRTIAYADLRRIEVFYPQIPPLDWLLRRRHGLVVSDNYTAPSGFRRRSMLRRIWTWSPDVLLQCSSGPVILFPLGALDKATSMEFQASLALHAPPEAMYRDRSQIEEALRLEDAGDRALTDKRWVDAVEQYGSALRQWEQLHQIDGRLRCLAKKSDALEALDRVVEARLAAVERLELARQSEDPIALADAFNGIARVEWNIGESEGMKSAVRHLEEATKLYHDSNLPFYEARMCNNAAIILESLFGVDNKDGHHHPEHLDRAEELASQALEILEPLGDGREHGDEDVGVLRANAQGTIAHCAFHRAENGLTPEKPADWSLVIKEFAAARQMVPQNKGSIPADDLMWGHSLFKASLTPSLAEGKRFKLQHQAMEKVDEAIRALPLLGDIGEAAEFLGLRGDLFWQQGNTEAACRDYESVVQLLEKREFVLSRPFELVSRRTRFRRIYARLVQGFLTRKGTPGSERLFLEKAFEYSERAKARSLRDLLWSTELLSIMPEGIRADIEKAQRDQQRAFLNATESATLQDDPDRRSERLKKLGEAEEALANAFRRALEVVPDVAKLAPVAPPSVWEVHAQLPSHGRAAVLQFSVCEDGLAVFLISPKLDPVDSCTFIPALGQAEIEGKLKKEFLDSYNDYAEVADQLGELERELWMRKADGESEDALDLTRKRFSELRTELEDKRRAWMLRVRSLKLASDDVISSIEIDGEKLKALLRRLGVDSVTIVPDGLLNRVPLHASLAPVSATFCPSCDVLLRIVRRARPQPANILIVDNPDGSLPLAARAANLIANHAAAAGLPEPSRLPSESERTAEFQAGAMEWILRRLPDFTWFHIGTHAKSDIRAPWRSYLHLAIPPKDGASPSERWERQFLRAANIATNVRVPTGGAAFVLGCSTGIVPKDEAGEFSGLPAAALACGYVMVIGTLWEVHEGTAVLLSDKFYQHYLVHGQPVAEALRRAAEDIKSTGTADVREFERALAVPSESVLSRAEEEDFPPHHPLHWAGFVVWGAGWTMNEVPEWKETRRLTSSSENSPFLAASSDLVKSLEDARHACLKKRWRDAASILESALSRFGPSVALNSRLADVYMELGDAERARAYEIEVVRLDPNSYRGHYNLGCDYRELGRVAETRDCFQTAIRLNPGYAKAYCNLAELTNDPGEALALLRKAASIDPEDEDYRNGIAMWEPLAEAEHIDWAPQRLLWAEQALQKKEFSYARLHIRLAKEAAASPIEEAMVYCSESDLRRQQGDIRGSIVSLEQAVARDSSRAFYWNNLAARRLLVAREPETTEREAWELLQRSKADSLKAIECADYSRPHQNLAFARLSLGELDDARREAQVAYDMARRQIASGPFGERICIGCPTEAKMPDECRGCREKSKSTLRDIELASGRYRV